MQLEIKVPSMGESISEATVGTVLKGNNSYVTAEEELIELETDKANQVLYAPGEGVVVWKVAKDEVVKIGQVIGTIDTSKSAPPPKPKLKDTSPQVKEQVRPQAKPKENVKAEKEEKISIAAPGSAQFSLPQGVRTSRESFVSELTTQQPEERNVEPSEPLPHPTGERQETRQKMSRIRKAIATRLVDVLQQTAMLTTFNEVDMGKVILLRESYKEAFTKKYGVRLGFMPFFVKAAVSAMKAYPEINAYIAGEDIVFREYFDIGIAVGTEKGLFVPVVRECDALSFADIEMSIEAFAKKAKDGRLSPSDLQGGGFTITNGGTYGSLLSTPILNPPQSAILGMHKIEKRPVVVDDQIVIRQMMYLALSYDHRVVDGKEAVSFLVHIKNMLEDPSRLVLGI
ncbi:MAG: 2-oxoglutarate dehydrogenase complex dihydrolipoyllysine-residue succinyltransferase [Parachlamydiaceae bacterium]